MLFINRSLSCSSDIILVQKKKNYAIYSRNCELGEREALVIILQIIKKERKCVDNA